MKTPLFFLPLLVIALTGCQSVTVETFSDPRFEMPEPARYSWEAGSNRLQGVLPSNRTAVQQGLREAITRELDARGWTLVDRGSADVVVRYVVGAHTEKIVTRTATGKSSFGGQSTVPTEVHRVRAGEIAIDLIHPEAGVVMWRGTAEGTLERVPQPEDARGLADRVATRILARLP